MSAVLESLPSPVAAARESLDAAHHALAELDQRIAEGQREVDENELRLRAHRAAKITAIGRGESPPKPPKLKVFDPDVVAILKVKRAEAAERVVEAEGALRRACVNEVERRHLQARATFSQSCVMLIDAWRELLGTKAVLDSSGFKAEPLPHMLTDSFAIPAMGKLSPIIENHWAHFVASHAIQQGELQRAHFAARAEVEADLKMRLPW